MKIEDSPALPTPREDRSITSHLAGGIASSRLGSERAAPGAPSSLYSANLWRLGLAVVRCFPHGLCASLARVIAGTYALARPQRRDVVIQNILPGLNNDFKAARKAAQKLFKQFALKLIDLWRYESGQPIDDLYGELSGWEHFKAAQAEGRGVLLLTPHLGNWEFGAPLMARRGVRLLVITMGEPQGQLTELRKASRERWGIETLVIGKDPFGFLEIIRRLESGATVALLIDRPPIHGSTAVELFGKRFLAATAPAELARASGCLLLPVYLPRKERSYAAHILPPVHYERSALRHCEVRQQLSQRIMRVFEDPIREHITQWYHFVPIWPPCAGC